MREILFRGKTVIGKVWIIGNLGKHYHTKEWFIQYPNECETLKTEIVIPETVGQFTGLTDKNGVKIFEHDIVKMYSEIMPEWAVTIKKVEWYKEDGRWNLGQRDARMIWEVVGNIHDGEVE